MNWVTTWKGMRTVQSERAPTPENPPHLMRPIKIRVLRAFCVQGMPQAPDTVLSLPRYVAQDMIALKKAELVT
jgi:hypothetical protein